MAAWLEINEPPWIPLFDYIVGQVILDGSGHTQIVTTAGTSGASEPSPWNSIGGTTADGSVVWTDLGTGGIAGSGWTDRTNYLSMSQDIGSHSWSLQLRNRGQAEFTLYTTDTYTPTIGTQVILNDVTSTDTIRVFAGTIDELEEGWLDREAQRTITVRCVTFEQLFDTVLVPTRLYQNQTAGYIFNDLLSLLPGAPVSAGTISAGSLVVSLQCDGTQTISQVYDQLAQISSYIWGVKIDDLTVYFQTPSTTAAPFLLTYSSVLMGSLSLKTSRQEFRDWQGIQLGAEAFAHSAEYFVGAGQTSFTLMRPCKQVTNVWVVYPPGDQNHAFGTLSGQPSDGDTITFAFPTSGSIYNWAAGATYVVDQIIIDSAGHIQRVTFAGTSGGSTPAWNDTGGVTVDNTVIWHDDGPAGFASDQLVVYTFVDVLDNREYGQVFIGPTAELTMFNLHVAINAQAEYRGNNYSLPTWENPLVNSHHTAPSLTLEVRNKSVGAGYIAAVSASCAAWSWDANQTYGGATGRTLVIPVGVAGTTTQGFVYTPGSAAVSLATPLNVGSSLQVEYIRADVGVIAVEDSALVAQRALVEDSTGLYQQITDGTNALAQTNNVTGLQMAQQALEAFSNYPQTMKFDTYVPGLAPGQYLNVTMNYPLGSNVLLNGNWVVQEVSAEAVPCDPYITGYGHYRYSIYLISVAQTSSYLDFWQQLGGSGGGGGGGISSSSIGGGSQANGLAAPVLIKGATIQPTLTLEQDTPSTGWAALTAYNVNDTISDFNSHIQLCIVGGTSGATEPYPWDDSGGTTADGTVTWQDQGEGGLSLLAGNGRFLYNCIMGAAAFPDNTGSGTAGHFGIDALITGLATQLYIRNTVGTPLLTFDSNNTRILADARVSITDSSAFDGLIVTQNGSSRVAILSQGAIRMLVPPAGAPAVSAANEARFYCDAVGILQLSQNGSAYSPLVPAGGPIAGSNTQIQYNNAGVFGASASLTWTNGSTLLRVIGTARINALNFPDNTGSGVAGNFGMDALISGLASQLYVRDTSGTPMLTFDSNNTRMISVATLGITVNTATQGIAVTQSGAGPGLYCEGHIQIVVPPAGAPAVSAANQARIYCDATGILKASQNGAAYVNMIGGGTPAGSNTQIQFNNAGAFGASGNLTWNGATLTALGVSAAGISVTSTGISVIGGVAITTGVLSVSHSQNTISDTNSGNWLLTLTQTGSGGGLTITTANTAALAATSGSPSAGVFTNNSGANPALYATNTGASYAFQADGPSYLNGNITIVGTITVNTHAGYTGTLAAAIAAGSNVDNGIIY